MDSWGPKYKDGFFACLTAFTPSASAEPLLAVASMAHCYMVVYAPFRESEASSLPCAAVSHVSSSIADFPLASPYALTFTPDSKSILILDDSDGIACWDTESMKLTQHVSVLTGGCSRIATFGGSDPHTFAFGSGDALALADLRCPELGITKTSIARGNAASTVCSLDYDGNQYVACARRNGIVAVFDVRTSGARQCFKKYVMPTDDPLLQVRFNPQMPKQLVAISEGRYVQVLHNWDDPVFASSAAGATIELSDYVDSSLSSKITVPDFAAGYWTDRHVGMSGCDFSQDGRHLLFGSENQIYVCEPAAASVSSTIPVATGTCLANPAMSISVCQHRMYPAFAYGSAVHVAIHAERCGSQSVPLPFQHPDVLAPVMALTEKFLSSQSQSFTNSEGPISPSQLDDPVSPPTSRVPADLSQSSITVLSDKGEVSGEWKDNVLSLPSWLCSYDLGYLDQSVYVCITCREAGAAQSVICESCAVTCHADHDIEHIGTKRGVRCDCGNACFEKCKRVDNACEDASSPRKDKGRPDGQCRLQPNKEDLNADNIYNQNFDLRYCSCSRLSRSSTITEEMVQCDICQDWMHLERCANAGTVELPEEPTYYFVCDGCVQTCIKPIDSMDVSTDTLGEVAPVIIDLDGCMYMREDWLTFVQRPMQLLQHLPELYLKEACIRPANREWKRKFEEEICPQLQRHLAAGAIARDRILDALQHLALLRTVIHQSIADAEQKKASLEERIDELRLKRELPSHPHGPSCP